MDATNGVSPDDFYAFGPATVECVVVAAKRQRVPANVLLALATMENGRNGAVVRNTNGTFDISHFQINTRTFRQELMPFGVKLEDMQWRGCYNAELAAYLLGKRLNERGSGSFWVKAANYHSKTPYYNSIYLKKLVPLSTEWAIWLQNNYSVVNLTYR